MTHQPKHPSYSESQKRTVIYIFKWCKWSWPTLSLHVTDTNFSLSVTYGSNHWWLCGI